MVKESTLSRSLFRSTAVVGQMTLVSRVLGFVRDIVIARLFGTSVAADAFFVAFRIPNLFRRLFAEGAFAQAFVPVLTEVKVAEDKDQVVDLVGATAGALGLILVFVVAIGILAAPWFIAAFAPGFIDDSQQWELATVLLRITFPYLLFISITALFGSLLNTYGRFAIPALTPALLNISLIGCALYLAPHLDQPVVALAVGVFIGGVAQFLVQFAAVVRLGVLQRVRINFNHPGVRKILRLMGPALFGVSVAQINLLIDTLIASLLETGSISWLYYSDRLMEFPLGVFGVALATVALPNLSRHHARGDDNGYSETLDWALRLTLLISLPAAIGLALLAEPMLSTLFQYRAFDERDVVMAGRSLVAYSTGLTAFILVKILAPGFYAKQDTRTPVRIGVIALCSNVVLNIIFVIPLAHAGLALATSLAAFINAGLLFRALRIRGFYKPNPGWTLYSVKLVAACLVMSVVMVSMSSEQAVWSAADALTRTRMLVVLIIAGSAAYFSSVFAFGIRFHHFSRHSDPSQ
ncbi:MAG: murein biosynthesis integral membrane protein MurJ [Proteobacteria bacterium]|nr:murein biosynthesis integral membrane protein MurJ [Pseudomonadota bacterium]